MQRVALVTGASRGIGRGIALSLARAGYSVAACARSETGLQQLAEEITSTTGSSCLPLAIDLRAKDAVDIVHARVASQLGKIEVLVNNAGTAPSMRFVQTNDTTLEEVLDLHVRVPFRLIRACLPAMLELPRACIVQIASSAGLRSFPFTGAYTTGKHGMVGMTRALCTELAGTSVKTYAICPGFVDTDITRGAAAAIAARGKTSIETALAKMGAMNRIGRMHQADEVVDCVERMVCDRPDGCIYDLDSVPPRFVDEHS